MSKALSERKSLKNRGDADRLIKISICAKLKLIIAQIEI